MDVGLVLAAAIGGAEVMYVLYILIAFMIIGSLIAVETRDLLSAVICVGAVGYGLAVIDLLLKAPDLALTQVVVEILVLVVLIRVIITRKDTTHETHRDTLVIGGVFLFMGVFLAFCFIAMKTMTPFGQPLLAMSMPYLQQGLERTGATNFVMSVLLDFRAYDTLGEATVIFAAIIGGYAVLRRIGRIGRTTQE